MLDPKNNDRMMTLHEEILTTMAEKKVDPFERNYRPIEDKLLLEVTQKIPDLNNSRITIGYWKKFSHNRKYLEAKSAANYQAIGLVTKNSKAIKRSVKKGLKHKIQDTKQPPTSLFYSFSQPLAGISQFDNHIIGSINTVETLTTDMSLPQKKSTSDLPSPQKKSTSPKKIAPLPEPIILFPGDVGSRLPGGLMGSAHSRPPIKLPLTQNTNLPSVLELDGGTRVVKGGSAPFGSAPRFPNDLNPSQGMRSELSVERWSFSHTSLYHYIIYVQVIDHSTQYL
jgi:hypothetical protein